jgi:hypothetical protein
LISILSKPPTKNERWPRVTKTAWILTAIQQHFETKLQAHEPWSNHNKKPHTVSRVIISIMRKCVESIFCHVSAGRADRKIEITGVSFGDIFSNFVNWRNITCSLQHNIIIFSKKFCHMFKKKLKFMPWQHHICKFFFSFKRLIPLLL